MCAVALLPSHPCDWHSAKNLGKASSSSETQEQPLGLSPWVSEDGLVFGILPRKILKCKSSEMPFPTF